MAIISKGLFWRHFNKNGWYHSIGGDMIHFKNDKIQIMDKSAIELCRANNLHIVVFNIHKKGTIKEALLKEGVGSVIK